MTRRFSAHFANGVLVPDERVDLPQDIKLTVSVEEPLPYAMPIQVPRHNDPKDPMPEGGVGLTDWWRRHALPIDPVIGDQIARSEAYSRFAEPDDES